MITVDGGLSLAGPDAPLRMPADGVAQRGALLTANSCSILSISQRNLK
jgi:hypothetical protein